MRMYAISWGFKNRQFLAWIEYNNFSKNNKKLIYISLNVEENKQNSFNFAFKWLNVTQKLLLFTTYLKSYLNTINVDRRLVSNRGRHMYWLWGRSLATLGGLTGDYISWDVWPPWICLLGLLAIALIDFVVINLKIFVKLKYFLFQNYFFWIR